MSTATYQPQITEVLPVTKEQRRLASEGFRGFWVEASGKTIVNHVRITKYLVTVMPSGYLKCPCRAGKLGRECCHKHALRMKIAEQDAYLAQSAIRQAETVAAKATFGPGPQATFACARPSIHPSFQKKLDATIFPTVAAKAERAILASHVPEGEFSIFKS